MGTMATKLPTSLERRLRERAKQDNRTPSEVLRLAVEEYLAPPSQVWATAMLSLNPRGRPMPRRKRPKDVDELTWAIDTLEP